MADLSTRYDTGTPQVPGMWFQIELPQPEMVGILQLDAGDSTRDYPRGYQVELSDDGQNWSQPVANGHGDGALTEITFPAAKTRFIRIIQTGSVAGLFWSIHELRIFKPAGPATNQAAAPKKPETS